MKIEIIEPKKQRKINFPVTARTVGGKRVVRFYTETSGIELSYTGIISSDYHLLRCLAPVSDETQWEIIPGEFDAVQPDDVASTYWDRKTFPVLMAWENNDTIVCFTSLNRGIILRDSNGNLVQNLTEVEYANSVNALNNEWQPLPPGTKLEITL